MMETKRKNRRKGKTTINALSKIKSVYAKRGDVNSCGDWLAVALKDVYRTEDGSCDLTAFKACLSVKFSAIKNMMLLLVVFWNRSA